MKTRAIVIVICIVLLGGLLTVYHFAKQNAEKVAAEKEAERAENVTVKSVELIDRTKGEVKSITVVNQSMHLNLIPIEEDGETKWSMSEYPDVILNKTNVDDLARSIYLLSASEKVLDKAENLSEYGLEPPVGTAMVEFTDGTKETVYIGNPTPAKDYYYCMLAGDEALYMMSKYSGARFYYTFDDLVDKTVATIDVEQGLSYINVKEKGLPELEMKYVGTEEERLKDIENYGTYAVEMTQPYPGREFYYNNFKLYVLPDATVLTLDTLVDFMPTDYTQYGLEEPILDIELRDYIENEIHFLIGDDKDDEYVYCKLADRPHVFTMSKSAVENFYGINVFKFIERFTALVNIDDLDHIVIESPQQNYLIKTNREELPPEGDAQKGEILYHPSVDGVEVQEKAFKAYYQTLIGLAYDMEIDVVTPTTEPFLKVTYNLREGKAPIVTTYYEYNKDFCAVQRDDNPIQFVVSKHTIEMMFTSMSDLLEGKLNK